MAEDVGLCTYVKHHKQKIAFFLACMREYRDELTQRGIDVHYEGLDAEGDRDRSYEDKLEHFLAQIETKQFMVWEIEDKFFEERIFAFAEKKRLRITVLPSPMFLTTRAQLEHWLTKNRPLMRNFYKWQRQRLQLMVNRSGEPAGGQWSFDEDNRKALPRGKALPGIKLAKPNGMLRDVIKMVSERFSDHPGELNEETWWLPVTRRTALNWLSQFLEERFADFGAYEDALTTRGPFLFHSVLSPMLNIGLLTPEEVLLEALKAAKKNHIPLNSLEGFVRQIAGWREFIRGIYRVFSGEQERTNCFDHHRLPTNHWYEGTTGLLPLDDAIRKAQRYGYTHHIERLMVVGNLMLLCEIEPRHAHRWFMEMYIDSSDSGDGAQRLRYGAIFRRWDFRD